MPRPDPDLLRQELLTLAEWTFARSSGPGGQNVNKVNTKAQLAVRLDLVSLFSERDREKLQRVLAARLDVEGRFVVTAQDQRTQLLNRASALDRAVRLILSALVPTRPRHATRPTRASRERRLQAKKSAGQVKRNRSAPDWES